MLTLEFSVQHWIIRVRKCKPLISRRDVLSKAITNLRQFWVDRINIWLKFQIVVKNFRRADINLLSRLFSETTTFIVRRAVRMNQKNISVRPFCSWKTNSIKKYCYGHSRQSYQDKLNQKVFPNNLPTWTFLKLWRKKWSKLWISSRKNASHARRRWVSCRRR